MAVFITDSASNDLSEFQAKHGKVYEDPEEEALRMWIFRHNRVYVKDFNEQHGELLGYEMELNHMADWTLGEYKELLGFKLPAERLNLTNTPKAEASLAKILADDTPLPDTVDWRKEPGRVTPVKDQKGFGACWAFSTTGVLEGQQLKVTKRKDLIGLSEQNLIDCVDKDAPGLPIDAMTKIHEKGGVVDDKSYPYTGKTGESCKFDKAKAVMTDSGYALLNKGDEEQLKQVVAKFGPVSVAIDASPLSFQLYRRGVYKSTFCKSDYSSLNHAVLVVGYGTTDKGDDYWLVKSSWNTVWGDEGYVRIARNRENMCGVATMAAIPTFDQTSNE